MSSDKKLSPLTTVFTPPSTCLSTIYSQFDGNYAVAPTDLAACYPSSLNQQKYWSPGICPSGYDPVDLTVRYLSATTKGSPPLAETDIACCPGLFHFSVDLFVGDFCQTSIDSGAAAARTVTQVPIFAFRSLTAVVTSYQPTTFTSTYVSNLTASIHVPMASTITQVIQTSLPVDSSSTHFITPMSTQFEFTSGYRTIFAQVLHVRAQSTDSAVFPFFESYLSGSDVATQMAPTGSVVSSPHVLGGGAIAGIVVGAVAFCAVLLGCLFFCLRRRKRGSVANEAVGDSHDPDERHKFSELDEATRKVEVPANQSPVELHSSPILLSGTTT